MAYMRSLIYHEKIYTSASYLVDHRDHPVY